MRTPTLRLIPLLGLGLLLILGAGGCQSLFGGSSDESGTDVAEYNESYYDDLALSLNADHGGYDATAEAPGFGDSEMLGMFGEETPAGDLMEVDPGVMGFEEEPDSRVTFLRLSWGQLRHPEDNSVLTDWSGSIQVDRGALVVLRLVRFEPATDWIVMPREDPLLVEFHSQTSSHFDGLMLKIVDPDPESGEPNDITIALGGETIVMPVADLDGYSDIIDVDDLGNQISLQSPEINDCPNGFLRGLWVSRHNGTDRGVFRGAITEYGGGLRGHLRGHWGINEEDEQVFRGKMIGRDGQFLAFIEGNWTDEGEGGRAHGEFEGVMLSEGGMIIGNLGGHYRTGIRRGGFLGGRWVEACNP